MVIKFINIISTFTVLVAIAYAGKINFVSTALAITSIGFIVLLLSADNEVKKEPGPSANGPSHDIE